MNDLLKQRILRALDTLSDERAYEVLDYAEFLASKYAERARSGGLLAKLTETVEDTMRAGKLPIQAISGTMGLMDSATKVMKGLAAAGQAVVCYRNDEVLGGGIISESRRLTELGSRATVAQRQH